MKWEGKFTTNRRQSDMEIHTTNEQTMPYLKVREAANYMRISERKLRELIATRELKIVRIGRRIIVRKVDIDKYMEQLAS